jgi:hypothetical protein
MSGLTENEEIEYEGFDAIKFPMVKNVSSKLLANEIQGFVPSSTPPPLRESYTNIWGDKVNVTKEGFRHTYGSGESSSQPGDYGHSFLYGWYVVDENWGTVYMDDEERYNEVFNKYLPFNKMRKIINNEFELDPIQRGPNNTFAWSDREIIPGTSFEYPTTEEEIEEIAESIIESIKKYKSEK